jgi:Protein of unknown function (DUF3768)
MTILSLNDAFRRSFSGGRVMLTAAVNQLPPEKVVELLSLVRSFDAFNADNDPHAEHDFGAIDLDGTRYFWKIDYYDLACEFGSDNPADPAVTTRVLTVMLASDY